MEISTDYTDIGSGEEGVRETNRNLHFAVLVPSKFKNAAGDLVYK
jgi:hypothetical protein